MHPKQLQFQRPKNDSLSVTRPSNLCKEKYLGKKKETSSSPDKFELDSVPNPHPKNNYVVRLTAPEFTSICPVTGQPDFGIIIIEIRIL